MNKVDFAKSVRIRSFSGLHFPAFGLNTVIYYVSLRISECGKMQTIKTPTTDTLCSGGSKLLTHFMPLDSSIPLKSEIQKFSNVFPVA